VTHRPLEPSSFVTQFEQLSNRVEYCILHYFRGNRDVIFLLAAAHQVASPSFDAVPSRLKVDTASYRPPPTICEQQLKARSTATCDCSRMDYHLNYADRGIQSVRMGRKGGHSSDPGHWQCCLRHVV
jgi:hypothetical protein